MTDADNKIIKCRCRATGRYFVIEVRRSGRVWAAVNFVDISAEDAAHIASEVYPEEVYTASNLLPCSKNGTRKVASCSLVKTPCGRCANSGRYSLDCIYCTELVRDNTGVRGPYTKWAGISNIPGATADRFGNPQGSSYDLAQDGAFSGYTIVWIDLTPVSNLAAKQSSRGLRFTGLTLEEIIEGDPDIIQEVIIPTLAIQRRAANGEFNKAETISQ